MCSVANNQFISFVKARLYPFYCAFRYGVSFSDKINLCKKVSMEKNVKIRGSHKMYNVKIGKYTYISNNSNISYATIGRYCSIGPNLLCGWGIHPTDGVSTSPMFYSTAKQNGYSVCKENKIIERKCVAIGNDVFIGANVTILDGVTVGDGAIIGAGTVVSKDVPPYAIVVGCPMRIMRFRFESHVVESLLSLKWWEKGNGVHKDIERFFFDVEQFIYEYERSK